MRKRPGTTTLLLLLLPIALLMTTGPVPTVRAAEEEVQEPKASGWEEDVDEAFGTYLVAPFQKVLFFDFWSKRWLRSGLPVEAGSTDGDCPYKYVFGETQGEPPIPVLLRRTDPKAKPLSEKLRSKQRQLHEGEIVPGAKGPLEILLRDDKTRLAIANAIGAEDTPKAGGPTYMALQAWPSGDVPVVIECPDWKDAEIETGQSVPLVVLWLFVGAVFFTLRMGFINIRGFWHAIRVTKGDYDNPEDAGEVSHFQALASALSATVGLGNIAGVAIAVSVGGPGAIFWLILAGLLGMSTKFTECTLGQIYREVDADGTVSGGPMHYLRKGLAELGLPRLGAVLATLFALVCMGGSFGGGCVFQVSQSLEAIRAEVGFLNEYPWVYGLALTVLVGVVIIGGIRRIAATAEKIVPLMCGIYVTAALYILIVNYARIPHAFALIIGEAFAPEALYGGFLGVMVTGIKRAAFSNEAGLGSASIAHAAAKTDEPVSEGIVALLEPFIDTVIVCTMTGLVIVITEVYNDPQYADYITNDKGAPLTAVAFRTAIWWFPYLLMVAVVLFAYSTLISWSYYGERCWSLLFGRRTSIVYKFLFMGFVFIGSIVTASNLKDFSDLMILSMAFPNILGVMLLSGKVRRALKDYWKRLKAGELDPKRG